MGQSKDLLDLLLLLRFGSVKIGFNPKPVLTYAAISKVVSLSASTVRLLILKAVSAKMSGRDVIDPPKKKLRQKHIDYLVNPQTLRYWAHLSLKQRAVLFHRQFPELRISASQIHRIYKDHAIRYKYIQRVKKVIDFNIPYYRGLLSEIGNRFREATQNGVRIIHADEAVFTFNTFMKKSWSTPYNSVLVTDQKITVKTMAVIAGISEDSGLETYLLHPRAIKTEEYLQFLEKLKEKYPDERILLFIDNLSVHKTVDARAAYERLNITPVFNVPYSPQFNGIESYWSILKQHYKKLLLYHLMHEQPVDSVDLIESSVKRVPAQLVKNCARDGREQIEDEILKQLI